MNVFILSCFLLSWRSLAPATLSPSFVFVFSAFHNALSNCGDKCSIQETHRPHLCQARRRVRHDSKQCDLWSHQITRQGECHLLRSVFLWQLLASVPSVVGRTQMAVCTECQLGFSGIGGCLKRAGCGFHSTVIQALLECLQFTLGRPVPRLSHLPCRASRNPHMCAGLGGGAVTARGCCEDIYFLPERRPSSGTKLPGRWLPSRLLPGAAFWPVLSVLQGATCGNETKK